MLIRILDLLSTLNRKISYLVEYNRMNNFASDHLHSSCTLVMVESLSKCLATQTILRAKVGRVPLINLPLKPLRLNKLRIDMRCSNQL